LYLSSLIVFSTCRRFFCLFVSFSQEMGGSVKFVYYSRLAFHELLNPGSRLFVPGPSVPPPNKTLRYEHQLCGKRDEEKAQELRLARIVRKIRVRK